MSATDYSHLAAAIFTIVAILQLTRALLRTPVVVGSTPIPVWASWIALVVAGSLAWLGFNVASG